MEINQIVIIIAAAAGGYLFGLLDRWVTQKFRKKKDVTPPEPPRIVEVFKENNVPGENTVLKVTVDQASKWHVELDGTRLENPAALSPEQRQRVVTTVVQIRPWIDGKVAQAPAAAPVPAPVQQPTPVRPAPAPQQSVAQMPPAPRPISTPSMSQPSTPPPTPVKADLGSSLRGLIRNDPKPQAIKPPSIVGMIDDVLQTKIPGTKFAGMGVRLEEGALGEVIVYVGASRYSGIDAVPDPEVQALIRSAITDWEKK